MSTKVQHIVFDWDGTIQDTISNIVIAWQAAAAELCHRPLAAADIKSMIGLSLQAGVTKVEPSISQAGIDAFVDCYRKHYFELEAMPSPLYDDIPELMDSLRSRGFTLTVATGKGRQGLDRTMASSGIAEHFVASRTACETATKPNPLMVQQLCQQVDVAPQATIVVGDAYFDMAMANNAGATGIGVSYGAGTVAELQEAQPQIIIDKPLQLLTLL